MILKRASLKTFFYHQHTERNYLDFGIVCFRRQRPYLVLILYATLAGKHCQEETEN